jgi:hypothetical protein
MKNLPNFEEFLNENMHSFVADKIDGKIDFLMNGDYDEDEERLKDLHVEISKLASTPKRKKALKYIETKIKI